LCIIREDLTEPLRDKSQAISLIEDDDYENFQEQKKNGKIELLPSLEEFIKIIR